MEEQSFEIPLQRLSDDITAKYGINLSMLRTDLNHPYISGNKLYKLKYNLAEAKRQRKNTILTFGGAFSNHIAATAAAGKENGLKTVGIIRGERTPGLNPTLLFAEEQGMELHFVSRELYRQKGDPVFLQQLQLRDCGIPDAFIIPEGGANKAGIQGCTEITESISIPFDYICCPCGTGTTLAGIVLSLKEEQKALGFQVLKGENYIRTEVESWLQQFGHIRHNWSVNENYHFGGYAKRTNELLQFVSGFEKLHRIPLDFIYTAKMMYGIYDLIKKGFFGRGQTVIAIHTGGLQGNAGFSR